ncbi:EAL domain-containing protein [Rhizobium sp. BK376]|uniref:putative bifunctional diguanylate cyclase/phosphodiesterase n=1 Tax=Rhizobium sp. BK376 TaxID=2512149 RepID=UPI0010487A65|nr:EAL domain-containing protein [Rhizobium sp. BK376]TCR93467.1 PAS domain S-box-containing protein/diguanylate cyclase (GGDEF)-like protein [Rhizobium sp. BK376]
MVFRLGNNIQFKSVLENTWASLLVSALVAFVVVVVGIALDRANTASYLRELQIRTENETNLIRARVAAQINIDVTVVRDLSSMISLSANTNSEEMERRINWLLIQNPRFISITIAPGFIVSKVFPLQSAANRIGRDVRDGTMLDQSGVRSAGYPQARFYGPINAGNGRNAFAIFYPIFVMEDGQRKAWGAVEVTVDRDMFYEDTGLIPSRSSENQERYPNLDHLSLAVRDLGTAAGDNTLPFFGSVDVLTHQPLHRRVSFAGGEWEVSAVPKAGWSQSPPNQLPLRLIIIAGGAVIILPIFFATLLLGERSRNVSELEARETRLLELSQRLNLALDSSNIGIWELQENGHNVYWDVRAASLHGHPPCEGNHPLESWLEAIVVADRPIAERHFFNCSVAGTSCTVQYRVRLEDGSIRHLRSVGSFYNDAAGKRRTVGIVADITADAEAAELLRNAKDHSDIKNAELELALDELSRREMELAELSTRLDLALNCYQCGIWEAVPGGPGALWDERMHELYGLEPRHGFMTEERWLSSILPEDRDLALESSRHFKQLGDIHTLICRVQADDGSIRYIRSTGKVHQTATGQLKLLGIAFDATEDALLTAQLKAANEEAVAKNIELELAKNRIEHNALHDPLTALANRRKLDLALEKLTADSRSQRQKFSILHIDLDRFKEINDTLGHAAGDAMLVHVSKVLARSVRHNDIVARIGGDEFVIVIIGSNDPAEMSALATRIIEEVRQPMDFEGFACRCGVSIGIAQAGGVNIDARKILIRADIALYRAKSMGRNRHEFFSQNLQAEIIKGKRTADAILAGLDNGEFAAWYQPQFSARTMELTGVEALVRWIHPTRGVLTPDQFLHIADELNVVHVLDRIVLETALKDKMRWAARGVIVPKVSVNVSSRRLHDDGLIDSLNGLQIAPGELSFELVESIFLDESEDVVSQNLERIKQLGIDIEIDDFGTGHTSIVSLLKLKPKRLKIDRQLVKPILTSPQERALVRSIIEIAGSLGIETVAEGVETRDHAVWLRELGCDLLQGYAFARPLSFEDFATAAAGNTPWQIAS